MTKRRLSIPFGHIFIGDLSLRSSVLVTDNSEKQSELIFFQKTLTMYVQAQVTHKVWL